jgi:hypothetical protein
VHQADYSKKLGANCCASIAANLRKHFSFAFRQLSVLEVSKAICVFAECESYN